MQELEENIRNIIYQTNCSNTPELSTNKYHIFATGPLRTLYFKEPKNIIFSRIQEILRGIGNIEISYLTNSDETRFGFEAMFSDPLFFSQKIPSIFSHLHLSKNIPKRFIFIQSGTTSCQVCVFYSHTNKQYESFQFGARNWNSQEFERFCEWVRTKPVNCMIDFGAHGYCVQKNKISSVNSKKLIIENIPDSIQNIYSFAEKEQREYVIPQREFFDIHTSPVRALHKMFPDTVLFDWGGGQIQEVVTNTKVKFEQNKLIN
jgi:hypothetical protein